ncbi:hypothetical protein DPMN_164512 [Dreissena polymorpha]|uniref:Uncharacterized protein n=1 Tax=Dreissena polymorpha TaxID=45954 RepID=A0A9D4EYN9_DREPO|nr:hypothetical protein DPMN_164512 [Dreissena polymorpha]
MKSVSVKQRLLLAQEEARIEKEKLNLNEERKKIEAENEKQQRALDIDLKLLREKREIIELCNNEEDVALIEKMIIREENQQPSPRQAPTNDLKNLSHYLLKKDVLLSRFIQSTLPLHPV